MSMEKELNEVWVSFQVVGFHHWENAPDEYGYLRDHHRHLFKFRVSITVEHNDREVEFHQLLNVCKACFPSDQVDFDGMSVESISDHLAQHLDNIYGRPIVLKNDSVSRRTLTIEVSEDGECGCRCRYAINRESVGVPAKTKLHNRA